MVQLSPSLTSPPDPCDHVDLQERHTIGPKGGSPVRGLEQTEAFPGYENYIENGLICLKHKVRNLEKKKIKLEEYRQRLKRGEALNKDQMASVEKYDEVLHQLSFAQELHHTLDSLTQNLLRSQRKAVKKEQLLKCEMERSRLSLVLQLQQVLQSLDRDSVQSDLVLGLNHAPNVMVQTLQSLSQLRPLLGLTRDHTLSLSEQMERAAALFMDLLDAKDKPVVGSTFKLLKEDLNVLVLSPYFNCLPPETKPCDLKSKDSKSKGSLFKFSPKQSAPAPAPALVQAWDLDFGSLKGREPPEHWDELTPDENPNLGNKPWRGGAALVPKNQVYGRRQAEGKRRKDRKVQREEHFRPMPMEVLSLPTDPELRRLRLEELLNLTHGAFSFMQDSVLDEDSAPCRPHHRLRRRASGCPSPLGDQQPVMGSVLLQNAPAQSDLRSPGNPLPKTQHSTPLPARRSEPKAALTNGELSLEPSDMDLSKDPQDSVCQAFPSPPLYRPEPSLSAIEEKRSPQSPPLVSVKPVLTSPTTQTFTTPPARRVLPSTHFNHMRTVFKVNHTLPPADFTAELRPAELRPAVNNISTQTPPEFAPPEDDMVYADYSPGSFRSPSRSGGRPAQRPVTGTPQAQLRGPGHFYSATDGEYEQNYRGGNESSAAWSDSSLGHSPERSAFILDSSQGDSLAMSTLYSSGSVDASLLPHPVPASATLPHLPPPAGPHTAPVLPLPLYPLSRPLRVAFTALRTANFAPGNLDQPIVFDQLHSNIGDAYEPHIGHFACPATGTYVFLFSILKLAINVPLYVNLMRNDEVMVSAYANDGAPDHETASNHAVLLLYQGDQVWLRLHRGAIYGSTWKYSTFSGFLLYQD